MSAELIRVFQGQETPAPGRWTLAPGQPVDIRTGRPWQSHSRTGRIRTGQLLITQDGTMAFRVVINVADMTGPGPRTLIYQSILIQRGRVDGSWPMDGELMVQGRILPATSLLRYHGVFRSGPGAVAWLGWRLPRIQIPGPDRGPWTHLRLSADLNAEAPPELCEPENRNAPTRRTPGRPTFPLPTAPPGTAPPHTAPPDTAPSNCHQETRFT